MFHPIDFLNLTLAGLIGAAIGFERAAKPAYAPVHDKIECAVEQEATIRTLLASGNWEKGLGLKSLHSRRSESTKGLVHIGADFVAHFRLDDAIEKLVARFGLEQGVYSARWSVPALMGGAPAAVDRFAAVP